MHAEREQHQPPDPGDPKLAIPQHQLLRRLALAGAYQTP